MAQLGYLDPGSGSMIVGAVAAGAAGAAVVAKNAARRAKGIFRRKHGAEAEPTTTSEATAEQARDPEAEASL